MRIIAAALVVLCGASAFAGDLIISADGFPVGHRGNGQFTLKQAVNADKKPVNCWSQNADNDGWVASFSDNGGILTVNYCRNGFPQAVYRITGTTLSAQNVGLTTRTITGPAPGLVSVQP